MKQEGTPFDDVFRTLLEKCTELIIPIINEIFGTHYEMSDSITLNTNEHYFTDTNGNRQKRITDSLITIMNHKYHIECESRPGKYIAVRIVEYGFHIALTDAQTNMKTISYKSTGNFAQEPAYTLRFPQSAVLYLRHNKNTPDNLFVRLILPDNTTAVYRIPVMKAQKYTKADIINKNLLFLIPFYILKFENCLQQINSQPDRIHYLVQEYNDIYEHLKVLQKDGSLNEKQLHDLIEITECLLNIVAAKADNVKREVTIMGGKVLELESDRLIAKGISEGIAQGISQGITQSISAIMRKLNISFEEACDMCDVPKEQYDLYRQLIEK